MANRIMQEISFRKAVSEIPSTTYGTFAIYRYPAKFIPQVVAFVLREYAKPGFKIFDPFAGYSTVGVVSRLYACNYELWDLNPLLSVIHNTAITEKPKIVLGELINELKNSKEEYIPKWSNLNYWFPEEFLTILSKTWGFVHSLKDERKHLLLIPLLKTTRYFSYSDEKIHKLYKSKYSKKKVEELLKKDWRTLFYSMLEKGMRKLLKKIEEYTLLKPHKVEYKIKAGVDVLEEKLENDVNILITSPPYLQAQEYIRSTKLELFWLGYDESFVKNLSKKEIPYRQVPAIKVYSETYYKFREKIKTSKHKQLYDNYFYAILKVLTELGENVLNYICLFVGRAKVDDIPIPIDEIVVEHLKEFGWHHEITFVDRIVSRAMFRTDINPATGREDSRIDTEYLVVLKRK